MWVFEWFRFDCVGHCVDWVCCSCRLKQAVACCGLWIWFACNLTGDVWVESKSKSQRNSSIVLLSALQCRLRFQSWCHGQRHCVKAISLQKSVAVASQRRSTSKQHTQPHCQPQGLAKHSPCTRTGPQRRNPTTPCVSRRHTQQALS